MVADKSFRVVKMGGLVIDIVMYFLIKSFLRFIWFISSSHWERIPATVMSSISVDPDWGCPFTRVSYKVNSSEALDVSSSEKPFLFARAAEKSIWKYPQKFPINVRVNPKKRSHTLLFDVDQKEGDSRRKRGRKGTA
jgi:hypothetical protein